LPSIDDNIRDGNSLIDTDFYDNNFDFGDDRKIKPFNWQKAFHNVFKQGGFDCVIGNPPYGASFVQEETTYFQTNYKLQNYQLDSYLLFLERSFFLLRLDGVVGFIIPNTWLLNLKTSTIRKFLFSSVSLENIVHYQNPVFDQSVVDTEIIIFRNKKPDEQHLVRINIIDKHNEQIEKYMMQKVWTDLNGSPINIFYDAKNNTIKEKTRDMPVLDHLCRITQGTKPFQIGKGVPKQTKKIVKEKPFVTNKKTDRTFRPLLRGSLMNRYQINWDKNYWIKFGDWLAEPRYSANYDAKEKIVIRQTGDRLVATLDTKQFIVRDNLYTIIPNDKTINLKYILGLLNSTFLSWYYQNLINPEKGEALAQVKRGHLAQLPIAKANKIHETDIIKLVDQLLKLNAQKTEVKYSPRLNQIEEKIAYCEDKINSIVYQLYGLNEEEIKIVEGNIK
jgi:hypothetical protein